MRLLALLLPLTFVSSASACLNDRDSDSLAIQARKLPDTLRVITGRFERNPPLFYEMRIRRSLQQLKQNPRQYGLYDDIAVAYDRLHRSDDALQFMAKKRALLPSYTAKNPVIREAWYRYYANAGTFRAHRWLSAGAQPKTIAEMKLASHFIKHAIQIKPNAHFGREKYQLMTMDWILATREGTAKNQKTLGTWISERDQWGEEDWGGYENTARQREATEGLSGLIVLGAAWQSPDVFEALATSLESKDRITLRYLALLRSRELLQSGKASLSPKVLNMQALESMSDHRIGDYGIGINDTNQKTLNELYPQLRNEADLWSGQRTAYMLTALEKGTHPDTHPRFWSGWKPAAPPSLDVRWYNERSRRYINEPPSRPLWATSLLILGGSLGATFISLRLLSRHRAAPRKSV